MLCQIAKILITEVSPEGGMWVSHPNKPLDQSIVNLTVDESRKKVQAFTHCNIVTYSHVMLFSSTLLYVGCK